MELIEAATSNAVSTAHRMPNETTKMASDLEVITRHSPPTIQIVR